MTLLVILLVVGVMAALSCVVYRRPTGRIDPEQLPRPERGAEERFEVDRKAPFNSFGGSSGTIW